MIIATPRFFPRVQELYQPAVQRILAGRNREEQALFLAFRNHYVFESRY
jgi:hypothetical protein